MYRLCYITRNYRSLNGAGNKAKTDNECTLQQIGAINLGIHTTHYDNAVATFFLNLASIIRMMFCVRRTDIIVLQYPVKKYYTFLCRIARWRGAKTITVMHDLMALHRHRISISTEASRLSHTDYIIASNDAMKRWIESLGVKCPIGSLGLFDYRSEATPEKRSYDNAKGRHWSIVYAGSVSTRKNTYLLQLAQSDISYDLHIYGKTDRLPGLAQTRHAICHPFTPPEDFIRSAEGDFGLVWDGNSLDNCTGDFGEYLRLNSPHKVSFYLRAGLPVIIWKEAAVAPIIQQEGIGLCIDSMTELDSLLLSVTDEQMQQMQTNIQQVSERLKNGYYLLQAINKALETMSTGQNNHFNNEKPCQS